MQPVFGQFAEAAAAVNAWWARRQALAYIFGIHPMLTVMTPELVEDDLLEVSSVGTDLEFSSEVLDGAIDYLLG